MTAPRWRTCQLWAWERYTVVMDSGMFAASYELATWHVPQPQQQCVTLGVFTSLNEAQHACERHARRVKRGRGPANDNGQTTLRETGEP